MEPQPYPPPGGAQGGGSRRRKKGWQHRGGPQNLGPRQPQFKPQQPHHPRAPQNLGFFSSVPSLEDLRAANKQQTRRHFSGPRQKFRRPPRGGPPKSIPRAPEHHHATALPQGANPLDTPAPEPAAMPIAGPDKLEAEGLNANVDFYGTNEGLMSLFGRNRSADSEVEEQSELEDEEEEYQAGPSSLNARLAQQEAYIADLEDQNLRLKERLELLQQELDALRAGHHHGVEQADSGGSAMSGPDSDDPSVAPSSAQPSAQQQQQQQAQHSAGESPHGPS